MDQFFFYTLSYSFIWITFLHLFIWTYFGIAFLWDWNENWPFPVLWPLLSFSDGRGTRDKIANILCIIKTAKEFQKNIYFCFIDHTKAIDCVDHNKLWKILKEMGISDHLTCLLRNLYACQEATVRTGHGTTDWFQIRKGCILSPAYLTSMQSTSCKMPGWMKHKLESRLPGEISITLDTQMTPPLWQKAKKN